MYQVKPAVTASASNDVYRDDFVHVILGGVCAKVQDAAGRRHRDERVAGDHDENQMPRTTCEMDIISRSPYFAGATLAQEQTKTSESE